MSTALYQSLRVPVTLQADGKTKGRFTADASVYDVISMTGHRIHSGAFTESLQTRGLPMLSWEHAWELGPMGSILDMEDGETSLRYNAQLYLESDLPNRLYQAILAKNIRDNSFAFQTIDFTEGEEDGEFVTDVTKADLFEACLCVVGANSSAGLVAVQRGLIDPDADARFAASLDAAVGRYQAERAEEKAQEEAARAAADLLRQVDIQLLEGEPADG